MGFRYQKAQFAVNNSAWTPISVAYRISSWAIKSSSSTAFYIRTNQTDSTTQDTVAGSNQEVCSADQLVFAANEVLFYVQSTAANDTLILSYLLA